MKHRRFGMQKELFDYGVAETSKQSLSEMPKETIAHRYQEYLDALWDMQQPSTDFEVCQYMGHSDPNYFRPRRWELENKLYLICECNPRPDKYTGKTAKTFWFTDKGLELVGGKQ
jgi:hypothetical protein